jgi:hypothetical protein
MTIVGEHAVDGLDERQFSAAIEPPARNWAAACRLIDDRQGRSIPIALDIGGGRP